MPSRGVAVLIAISVLLAGCGAGAGTDHRRPARIEVFPGDNQHADSLDRFVTRTAGNRSFLVPAQLAPAAVDLIDPRSVNVAPFPPLPQRTTVGYDGGATAVIERPYRIEVIASGPVGTSVDIFWEETCGSHRDGRGPAESGGTGGEGNERARLPAVLAVKLPQWSSGEDSCLVTSSLITNHFEHGLSVELVNY